MFLKQFTGCFVGILTITGSQTYIGYNIFVNTRNQQNYFKYISAESIIYFDQHTCLFSK